MGTTLPAASSLTGSSVTEAQFKIAIIDLRTFLAGLLGDDGAQHTAQVALGVPFASSAAKSANYTVVAADLGKVIRCTGTWTLSLTAAATLADGFNVMVINEGSGTITIDPNGAETVGGAGTLALGAGQSLVLHCTGSAWLTSGKSGGVVQTFNTYTTTSGGTFTVPAGITKILVTAFAGGGGGSGSGGGGGESNQAGTVGGSTTLSGAVSLTLSGGAGGTATTTSGSYTAGGGPGGTFGVGGASGKSTSFAGKDGATGASVVRQPYTVTPGTTITISVGAGGNGGYAYSGSGAGGSGSTDAATAGTSGSVYAGAYWGGAGGGCGYVLIEW